MQQNQTESSEVHRVGSDEKLIHFRPSPNFKNMKKFFRMRMQTPDVVENVEVPTEVKLEVEPKPPAPFQPPLPLDPPPPDNPEPLLIPKLEKEDPPPMEEEPTIIEPIIPQEDIKTDKCEDHKSKTTVCKDFIRGCCTRAKCRFLHDNSAAHRIGAYTFCRKFQNGVCEWEQCTYVHADIFQEANFYRTGILPPNALAHIKPRKPPQTTVQTHLEPMPVVLPSCSMPMNMPPSPSNMTTHIEQQMPMMTYFPQASTDPVMGNLKVVPEDTWSPNNMNWMTNAPQIQHDQDMFECSNCDYIKYRYKNTKQVAEERVKSLEVIQQNIDDIDHKTRMMNLVFLLLLRPHASEANPNMEGMPQVLSQMQTSMMPPYY